MDYLSLICSLQEHLIRKWVAKEQETWHTMEDVFKSIKLHHYDRGEKEGILPASI